MLCTHLVALVATLVMFVKRTVLSLSTKEHALSDKECVINKHLRKCEHFEHIRNLRNLPDICIQSNTPPSNSMDKETFLQAVRRITRRWELEQIQT